MATFTIDLLSGKVFLFNKDFTGSGSTGGGGSVSGSTYNEVNTFAELPSAGSNNGIIYIVRQSTGSYVLNRKEAGLYYSNGLVWRRLGDIPSFFSSENFQVYEESDSGGTTGIQFITSGITQGNFRQLQIQDSDGTIAYLTDVDGKVDTSIFNAFTANTTNELNNKLDVVILSGYSATTNTRLETLESDVIFLSAATDTKLDISLFNNYSGETDTRLSNIEADIASISGDSIANKLDKVSGATNGNLPIFASGGSVIIDSGFAVEELTASTSGVTIGEFNTYTASTDNRFIVIENNIFSLSGQTSANSLAIQSNDSDIAFISGVTDTKLNSNAFTGYTASTDTRLIGIESDITLISGVTDTKLNTSLFEAYTGNTRNNEIQLLHTGVTQVNTVIPTALSWDIAQYSGSSYVYTGGSVIQIQESADYIISYNVMLSNTTNQRKSLGANITVNNIDVLDQTGTGVSLVQGNGNTGSLVSATVKVSLSANDNLRLAVFRNGNSGNVNTVANSTFIRITKDSTLQ